MYIFYFQELLFIDMYINLMWHTVLIYWCVVAPTDEHAHASISFKITLTHEGSGTRPTNPDWLQHKSEWTREAVTERSYWPSNLEEPGYVAAKVALLASVVKALRKDTKG